MKTFVSIIIFILTCLVVISSRAQQSFDKFGGWKIGIRNYYGSETGLYSLKAKGSTVETFPTDHGSAIRPDLFNSFGFNEGLYYDANIGLFDMLNMLFLPNEKSFIGDLGTSYRPTKLIEETTKSVPNYQVLRIYQGDIFHFKLDMAHKLGLLYGVYWTMENIGINRNGFTNFQTANNTITNRAYFSTKSIWGLNIGYAKAFKHVRWVSTMGLGRDIVVYRDNGRIPDGFLVNGSDFLITRNYFLNSTIYYGEKRGAYAGINYDITKGKTDNGTNTFKMSKFDIRLGIYLNRK